MREGFRALSQLFRQVQHQLVVVYTGRVGRARRVPVPDAAAVGHVAPLHVHPLGAAVAAVQAHAQVHGIRVPRGDGLGGVHQPRPDAPPPELFQYAEIDDLRPAPPGKGPAVAAGIHVDVAGDLARCKRVLDLVDGGDHLANGHTIK